VGIELTLLEIFIENDLLMQGNGGVDAFDYEHSERAMHPRDCLVAVASVYYQFRDE
jgi:hypothetical protein